MDHSRRQFVSELTSVLGAGWLKAALPALTALAACAREAAVEGEPFRVLSAEQSRTFSAVANRIFPSDSELPGAEEAGVVWFIDRALEGPFAALRDPIIAGAADLEQRSVEVYSRGFDGLNESEQDDLIRGIVDTPFFGLTRLLTIAGIFADPSYGGNRDGAAQMILGVEHAAGYQPPFGWYDAEHAAGRGL